MKKVNRLMFVLIFTWGLLSVPTKAYAYLDPGSGSYLIQIILAGLLTAGIAIKSFWLQIKIFFTRVFNRHSKPPK